MEGWIKLHRKITEWGWWYDGNMLKVWIWLIMQAKTHDVEYKGEIVRRGSLVTSYAEISKCCSGKCSKEKLSVRQARTILKRLQLSGEITLKSTNQFSIISICHYDIYQGDVTLFDKQVTSERQASDKQVTNLYNKKERNKEINITHSHARDLGFISDLISDDEVYEIRKIYNSRFEGYLPACERMSLNVKMAIRQCLTQFGKGSVDIVFQKLEDAGWLSGGAPSGWRPDLKWIFQMENYQRILNGYYSPKPKSTVQQPPKLTKEEIQEAQSQEKEERLNRQKAKWEEERQRLLGLIDSAYIQNNLSERTRKGIRSGLIAKYNDGTLRKYGIEWTPPVDGPKEDIPTTKNDVVQKDISYIQNILNT